MSTQPGPVAGVAFVDSPSLILPAAFPTLVVSGGVLGIIAAGSSSATPIGGSSGAQPAAGANLTDATATINPGTDLASQYTLPAATPLTANRVLTLGVTGSPVTNSIVSIWKLGAGAFTYTINDDAATTLLTFASNSQKQLANFYYNGTHFVFLSLIYTA